MGILRSIQRSVPDCVYRVHIHLGSLKENLDMYKVNLDPDYQREYVWTELQKKKFVGSLLENCMSIPPLWFNWISNQSHRDASEVVDGKQRIMACLSWLNNEITAICPCGAEVMFRDLDEIDMRNIRMSVTMRWNFVELSKVDVMRFYLRLNNGGTVHTEEDIEKVRRLIKDAEK